MPVETMSIDSAQLMANLVDALGVVSRCSAILVSLVLVISFIAGHALKRKGTVLPEWHQLGAAKGR